MSVLAGVDKRLEESEKRLTELIQHLEQQASLEKSLNDAGRGLGEASSNLGELAASTKVALESLKSVVDALQETVEILVRSNPAETAEAVARIEKKVEHMAGDLNDAIGKALKTVTVEHSRSHDRAMRISYMTLVVVVAVLALETVRFFL